jgi:hypothetical protein
MMKTNSPSGLEDRDLELNVRKFNAHISTNCEIIRECHAELTDVLNNYDFGTLHRARIDRALVRMSVASRRVLDLVAPLPSSGEIHGLPREATLLGDEPDVLIVDKDNPKWDFRPWLTEKAMVIGDSLNKLMEYLETDPAEMEFGDDARLTTLEFLGSMIGSNLAKIGDKAQTILDMIRAGRITVIDVRLDDDELD